MEGIHTPAEQRPVTGLHRFIDRYQPVFEALSRSATPFGSNFFTNY
ncbi:hypothetical protein [uncultured Spirosoma sp.]|nr:hypothetical protein [uncultured Spirosoma sp.]